jgi:hypothetical protein
MDIVAEVTLRIARMGQTYRRNSRTEVWFFVPEWRSATWDEARDILTGAEKPLLVCPLVEPGYLSIWSVPGLPAEQRARTEAHMANQVEYFAEKVQVCGLTERDSIVLDATGSPFTIGVRDLMQWARDYTISIGVTIGRGNDPGTAYLYVMPPGGGAPPIGVPLDAPHDHHH